MRVLVDTNICLDILQKRPEFYDLSKNALFLASAKKFKMFITTTTVMDIIYITRKYFQDNTLQKSAVQEFISAFKILNVSKRNIKYAFSFIAHTCIQNYALLSYHQRLLVDRSL
jgi:predicted nucleic acid-binding protein